MWDSFFENEHGLVLGVHSGRCGAFGSLRVRGRSWVTIRAAKRKPPRLPHGPARSGLPRHAHHAIRPSQSRAQVAFKLPRHAHHAIRPSQPRAQVDFELPPLLVVLPEWTGGSGILSANMIILRPPPFFFVTCFFQIRRGRFFGPESRWLGRRRLLRLPRNLEGNASRMEILPRK